MSKAEKFIQDYTKNCSNELCAVEDKFGKKVISYHKWLTPDQALRAVEIAREEIYEWLQENASKYTEKQDTIFGAIKVLNSHKLVNDLKQAIKDE
jgi:sRNA-binding carbon storage regulator CsrA